MQIPRNYPALFFSLCLSFLLVQARAQNELLPNAPTATPTAAPVVTTPAKPTQIVLSWKPPKFLPPSRLDLGYQPTAKIPDPVSRPDIFSRTIAGVGRVASKPLRHVGLGGVADWSERFAKASLQRRVEHQQRRAYSNTYPYSAFLSTPQTLPMQ